MDGKKMGRPTDYTPELADRICELVATSTHGTKKLCKLNDWMPDDTCIYKWRYRHEDFARKYAEAKARQADLLAEEIIEIADDGLNDTYVDDEGNVKVDTDIVQRSRLRIDTRKWLACKLLPKIYGERQPPKTEDSETLIDRVIDKL
jgi:hypothetical protein